MKTTTNRGTPRSQTVLRKVFSACSACSALYVVFVLVHAQEKPAQTVSPQAFVGTWVGVQTWAIASPSPGAKEDQEVTLTVDEFNGKLVGSLTPFFGGSDGASFVNGEIVGDALQASGTLGPPPPRAGERWKDAARIQFAFSADRNNLKGTADIQLNGVKWLKFNYDLSRKRSRY